MSTSSENEVDLELLLLPAWAKQSPEENRYAHFKGDEGPREDRRDRRGPPRGREGDRRPLRPEGNRQGGPPRRGQDRPRREGGPRRDDPREERREPPVPLPEVAVTFAPEPKGVEALTRQIKLTGRAYPLFDIAQLVLKKADRYVVTFGVVKRPDGQVAQPLFVCNLDDTLWTSEAEAVAHALRRHFDTFYKAEKTAASPPKGTYTFVAQCGMSGVILGPPNYHDYQKKLAKLHAERFARMPFDMFKSRVKIVRDEVVVKQWIDEQSWKTEYVCLNVPEEKKLGGMEEVEKHFRETHLASIIKPVESHTVSGQAATQSPCGPLRQLVRREWDALARFPLKLVNFLSQQFTTHGLQFFKTNKGVTHVSIARPRHLDLEATPVSDSLKRIMQFIEAHPRCTRRQILAALAPTPTETAPTPVPAASLESGAPAVPGEVVSTPEQIAVVTDLHWLLHQGHVIEFASGVIEAARKPQPKPAPKPVQKPAAIEAATVQPAESAIVEAAAPAEPAAGAAAPEVTTPEPAMVEPTAASAEATPAPVPANG